LHGVAVAPIDQRARERDKGRVISTGEHSVPMKLGRIFYPFTS